MTGIYIHEEDRSIQENAMSDMEKCNIQTHIIGCVLPAQMTRVLFACRSLMEECTMPAPYNQLEDLSRWAAP